MNIIKNIIRYPIKGLSGEYLDEIILKKDAVLPGANIHIAIGFTIFNNMKSRFILKNKFFSFSQR